MVRDPDDAGGDDAKHEVTERVPAGKDEVWVGRQSGGLTVLTANGDSFTGRTYTQADGLAQNSVYSVHRNNDGTVWAGTVSAGVSGLADGKFTNFSEAQGLPGNTINSMDSSTFTGEVIGGLNKTITLMSGTKMQNPCFCGTGDPTPTPKLTPPPPLL